jgi:phosphopantetheinyl transferase
MNQLIIRATSPYAEAFERACPQDRQEALRRIGNEVRRAEWLSWRNLAREMLGEDVCLEYNSLGSPVIRTSNNTPRYISVSHCRSHVAIALSDAPCGVDIEWSKRNFDRAASRFLSFSERMLEFTYPDLMVGAAWCAKEAVYKYYCAQGEQYPDFLGDIRITACNLHEGRMMIEAGANPAVEVLVRWENELIVASVGIEIAQSRLHTAQPTNLEE